MNSGLYSDLLASGPGSSAAPASTPAPSPSGGLYDDLLKQSGAKVATAAPAAPEVAQKGLFSDLVTKTGDQLDHYTKIEGQLNPQGWKTTADVDPTGTHHNPGSLHYKGLAVDAVSSAMWDDAHIQQLHDELAPRGVRIIDERYGPSSPGAKWTGPHVHFEYNPSKAAVLSLQRPKNSKAPFSTAAAPTLHSPQIADLLTQRQVLVKKAQDLQGNIDRTTARYGNYPMQDADKFNRDNALRQVAAIDLHLGAKPYLPVQGPPTKQHLQNAIASLTKRASDLKAAGYKDDSPQVQGLNARIADINYQLGGSKDLSGKIVDRSMPPIALRPDEAEVSTVADLSQGRDRPLEYYGGENPTPQLDARSYDQALSGMSYAHALQMPGDAIAHIIGAAPAITAEAIGHPLTPAEEKSTAALANAGSYFIPGFGEAKAAVDLFGQGVRIAEIGPKAAGAELVKGFKDTADPFQAGLSPLDRAARTLNLAIIAYGVASAGASAKTAITDAKISKALQTEFGYTKGDADLLIKNVKAYRVKGQSAWDKVKDVIDSSGVRESAMQTGQHIYDAARKARAGEYLDAQITPEPAPPGTKALPGRGAVVDTSAQPVDETPSPSTQPEQPKPAEVRPAEPAGNNLPSNPPENIPSKLGGVTVGRGVALSPADDSKYPVEFRVVPMGSLISSHDFKTGTPNESYPGDGAQMRDRSTPGEMAEVDRKAKNLDPERLLINFHATDRGAPLVGSDGVVESGNGRVMALQKAASQYPMNYRSYVKALVAQHPEAKGIENPVLVQVRQGPIDARIRKQVGMEANRASSSQMSSVEEARQDEGALPEDFEKRFEMVGRNLEAALDSSKNRVLAQQFISKLPDTERASMIDTDGKVSEEARRRMSRAIMYRVLGDKSMGFLYSAYHDADFAKNVLGGLDRGAGELVSLQHSIKSGTSQMAPGLRDALVQSLGYIDEAKRSRLPMSKWFEQGSLEQRDQPAMRIGKALVDAKSPSEVSDVIANLVHAAGDSSGGMFGDELSFKNLDQVVESVLGPQAVGVSAPTESDITKKAASEPGKPQSDIKNDIKLPTRSAFAKDFPAAIVHQPQLEVNTELHTKAKAGDVEAAVEYVDKNLNGRMMTAIHAALGGRKPVVVAVHGQEAKGINAIPISYAIALGRVFGLPVDRSIVMTNKPMHTGAEALHRLQSQAEFAGHVAKGKEYFIVDDYITMGITVADLKGYIEARGGKVILVSSLGASKGSEVLVPSEAQIARLRTDHPDLEERLGHPLEGLTKSEASNLIRNKDGVTSSIRRGSAAEQTPDGKPGAAPSERKAEKPAKEEGLQELASPQRKGFVDNVADMTDDELEQASAALDQQIAAIHQKGSEHPDYHSWIDLEERLDEVDGERAARAAAKKAADDEEMRQFGARAKKSAWKPDPLPGGYKITKGKGKKAKQVSGKLSDLIDEMGTVLDRKILEQKRKLAGAGGVYFTDSGQITTRKANDLPTAAHELGHAIDDYANLVGKWSKRKQKSPYDSELKWFWENGGSGGPKMPLNYNRAEGVAEFVRAYVENPKFAERKAPKFFQYFESQVPADVLSRLKGVSEHVRQWHGQSAGEKVGSAIVQEGLKRPNIVSRMRSRVDADSGQYKTSEIAAMKARTYDYLAPFVEAWDEVLKRAGIDPKALRPSNDPITLARTLPYSALRFESILEHGMVLPNGKVITPPAKYLQFSLDHSSEAAMEKDQEDLDKLLVSERVSEFETRWSDEAQKKIADADQKAQDMLKERRAELANKVVEELRPILADQLGRIRGEAKANAENAKKTLSGKALQDELNKIEQRRQNQIAAAKFDHNTRIAKAFNKADSKLQQKIDRMINRYTRIVLARLQERLANVTPVGGGTYHAADIHAEHLKELKADPERYAKLSLAAAGYRQWSDATLEYLYRKGRLSKETLDYLRASGKQYAALQRFMGEGETVNSPSFAGGGLARPKEPIKTFKGSSKMIRSPFVNLLENTFAMIKEADRNEVWDKFFAPFRLKRVMYQGSVPELTSIAQRVDAGTKDAIRVWHKGVEEHWLVEKGIEEAVRRQSMVRVPTPIDKILSSFARVARWGTIRFPSFIMRHRFRHSVATLTMSQHPMTLLDWVQAPSIEEKRLYQFYGGGIGRGFFTDDAVDFYAIRRRLAAAIMPDKRFVLLRAFGKLSHGYHEFMASADRSPHIAAVRAARRAAKKKYPSVYDQELFSHQASRDIVDFAQKGALTEFVSRYIYPFGNADVQGERAWFKAVRRNPKLYSKKWLLYLALPVIAQMIWNKKRGAEEEYRQLPAYQRDFFYNMKMPDGRWLSIPKSYEGGVASSFFERSISRASGDQDAFEGFGSSAATAAAPIDWYQATGPVLPLIEDASNKDFFRGGHVVPQSEEDLDIKLRKGAGNASRISYGIGSMLNVDPRKVDHAIRGYLSDAGTWIMDLSDAGRADRPNQIKRSLSHMSGIIREAPALNAVDVQWVMEKARSVGARNPLSGTIRAYMDAKNPDDKERFRVMLLRQASQMRFAAENAIAKQPDKRIEILQGAFAPAPAEGGKISTKIGGGGGFKVKSAVR